MFNKKSRCKAAFFVELKLLTFEPRTKEVQ